MNSLSFAGQRAGMIPLFWIFGWLNLLATAVLFAAVFSFGQEAAR